MDQKTYAIQWRPAAVADLDAIIDFIGKDSPKTAGEFGELLREKTLMLADHPQAGRSGRPGLPAYVLELVVHRHYIVFYRIRSSKRIVEILRIKHTARQTP